MNISRLFVKMFGALDFAYNTILSFFFKRAMGECGKNVMIKPSTSVFKGLENIHISNNVRIARYAVIYTTKAKVYIGPKTGIAPYLKIISGNHSFGATGHFMFDADYPKGEHDDKDVILEGDHWIGINVTILSGVTIGRGSVVAAGAVVNKSCPPYSIIGGVPAKVLKYRFTIDEAIAHEEKLYAQNQRYSREYLINSRL